MKKLTLLTLSLILILSLVACASNTPPEEASDSKSVSFTVEKQDFDEPNTTEETRTDETTNENTTAIDEPTTKQVDTVSSTDMSIEDVIATFKEDPTRETIGEYSLDDYGTLHHKDELLGTIHTLNNNDEIVDEAIYRSRENAVFFDDGMLISYSFGEKTTLQVGNEAIYCGRCSENSFVFRIDNKVYLIPTSLVEKQLIATGVDKVLASSYVYSTDYFAQPMLLMEDGSIKVYVDNELVPPRYEGGYGGTAITY